jgi:hypothetical protein
MQNIGYIVTRLQNTFYIPALGFTPLSNIKIPTYNWAKRSIDKYQKYQKKQTITLTFI